ncbi:MAG: hypothetical protein IPK35_07125 [Saprospiraceae bacterium]|nr:hypothetical protein [Saprospiraceae bacterium]
MKQDKLIKFNHALKSYFLAAMEAPTIPASFNNDAVSALNFCVKGIYHVLIKVFTHSTN